MMSVSVMIAFLITILIANREVIGHHSGDHAKCPALVNEPWSYSGKNGAEYWGLRYPDCYKQRQSPISVDTLDLVEDKNLHKLFLKNYDKPVSKAIIENNGHSIEVIPKDDVTRSIVVNGDEYDLHQLHFHWGLNYSVGSEHDIDGTHYAMEIHFVHMKGHHTQSSHKSQHEEPQSDIAVVAVFCQEEDQDNKELQVIVENFGNLLYKDDEVELKSPLDLNKLLPANPTSFYRYLGSLTTPGCTEGVIWSLIPNPIPVGRDQMKKYREIYAVKKEDTNNGEEKGCKLSGNYRPEQPLNGRKVYCSQ